MPPHPEADERAPGTLATPRSVLLGCVLCGLIGLAGPYWCFYLMSSTMFADYHTAGATFSLLLLIVVFNLGLARAWPRSGLRGGELRLITAMTLTSGSIATSGLIAYLVPGMTAPYYHANETNLMHTRLWPHLPKWLFALDPDGGTVAIRKFWLGLPAGEPIPWGPWIRPLTCWGIFVLAMFACMLAVMTIMRKQWMDHEHLSYPIAQVPAELCRVAERGGASGSILRSRAFWIGGGIAFLLASSAGLRHYFGFFPAFNVSHRVTGLGPMDLPVNLRPVVLGLVFLIPNRVAFSVWFLALVSWVLRSFLRAYNLGLNEWMLYGVVGHPELQHMAMGSMIAFTAGSLWVARRHLRRVVLCALGRQEGYDAGEPASYRSSLLVLAAGGVVALVWFRLVGFQFFFGAILLLLTFVVYYAMARVIAQCGLPAINSPVVPSPYMASAFGTSLLGREQVIGLGTHLSWHADLRNSPLSGAGHGMYLTGRRSGGLLWLLLVGLVITYVAGTLFTVRLGYRQGASGMHPWYVNNSSNLTWYWTSAMSQADRDPSCAGMAWMGSGAVVMAALMVAQRLLFWWPIHPVGFLTSGAYLVTAFWFSIFLAWFIKVLVTYFGGGSAYRAGRRFFIGLVLGYFVAGGIWAIIDTCARSVGNAVFVL